MKTRPVTLKKAQQAVEAAQRKLHSAFAVLRAIEQNGTIDLMVVNGSRIYMARTQPPVVVLVQWSGSNRDLDAMIDAVLP